MIEQGRIDIVLEPELRIISSRPNNLGRIFIGKQASQVVAQVKLLFSLCGHAHSLAARQALGLNIEYADRRAVVIETLREHFTKMATGWRELSGLKPDIDRLKSIFIFFRQQGNAQQAEALLETLSARPEQILSDANWMTQRDSDAARFLTMVKRRGWESVGDLEIADQRQATVLGLCEDEPIMQELLRLHGWGLFTRFYARLVHCTRLVEDLRQDNYTQNRERFEGVETSRGFLRHWGKLQNGLVSDYHIEAPTDVNFRLSAALMKALEVTRETNAEQLLEKARLLVEAFDPCVPYEVRACDA